MKLIIALLFITIVSSSFLKRKKGFIDSLFGEKRAPTKGSGPKGNVFYLTNSKHRVLDVNKGQKFSIKNIVYNDSSETILTNSKELRFSDIVYPLNVDKKGKSTRFIEKEDEDEDQKGFEYFKFFANRKGSVILKFENKDGMAININVRVN